MKTFVVANELFRMKIDLKNKKTENITIDITTKVLRQWFNTQTKTLF